MNFSSGTFLLNKGRVRVSDAGMKITIIIENHRPPCEIDRWEVERIREDIRMRKRERRETNLPDMDWRDAMETGWRKKP